MRNGPPPCPWQERIEIRPSRDDSFKNTTFRPHKILLYPRVSCAQDQFSINLARKWIIIFSKFRHTVLVSHYYYGRTVFGITVARGREDVLWNLYSILKYTGQIYVPLPGWWDFGEAREPPNHLCLTSILNEPWLSIYNDHSQVRHFRGGAAASSSHFLFWWNSQQRRFLAVGVLGRGSRIYDYEESGTTIIIHISGLMDSQWGRADSSDSRSRKYRSFYI